jgi:hypothetical protein
MGGNPLLGTGGKPTQWRSKSCKKIEVISIQTRREQIAVFAQMWRDFISVKSRSGWERRKLCVQNAFAASLRVWPRTSIFQSLLFRSNLAGWQTGSLGRRNSSRLRFATLQNVFKYTEAQTLKCWGLLCSNILQSITSKSVQNSCSPLNTAQKSSSANFVNL